MAVNTTPIFTKVASTIPVTIAAANTASDGSGALVTLITAPTDGCRVDAVTFKNSQTTAAASTAMVVRVFLSDGAGANFGLIGEAALPAATRSASAIGTTVTITFSPAKMMKTGQVMSVCQSAYAGAQDRVTASPDAGDFTG